MEEAPLAEIRPNVQKAFIRNLSISGVIVAGMIILLASSREPILIGWNNFSNLAIFHLLC